jgi:hypothetical protein
MGRAYCQKYSKHALSEKPFRVNFVGFHWSGSGIYSSVDFKGEASRVELAQANLLL